MQIEKKIPRTLRTLRLAERLGNFLPTFSSTIEFFKRALCLALAQIYFFTQIVFAQSVIAAMPRNAIPNFFHGIKSEALAINWARKVIFNALPYGFDKEREDRERSGYQTPESVLKKEEEQRRRLEMPQEMEKLRGLQPQTYNNLQPLPLGKN